MYTILILYNTDFDPSKNTDNLVKKIFSLIILSYYEINMSCLCR